ARMDLPVCLVRVHGPGGAGCCASPALALGSAWSVGDDDALVVDLEVCVPVDVGLGPLVVLVDGGEGDTGFFDQSGPLLRGSVPAVQEGGAVEEWAGCPVLIEDLLVELGQSFVDVVIEGEPLATCRRPLIVDLDRLSNDGVLVG